MSSSDKQKSTIKGSEKFSLPDAERSYIAIDLKSFYASVECRERGLDPLDSAKWVNLVCSVLNQALFMTALLMLTGLCIGCALRRRERRFGF